MDELGVLAPLKKDTSAMCGGKVRKIVGRFRREKNDVKRIGEKGETNISDWPTCV